MSLYHFGEGTETLMRSVEGRTVKIRWNWGKFKTTEGFPVDDSMINWVIGQEQALNESYLCLNEGVHNQNRPQSNSNSHARVRIVPDGFRLFLHDTSVANMGCKSAVSG